MRTLATCVEEMVLPGCTRRGSTVPENRSTSTFWFTPTCFSPATTRWPLGSTSTTVAVIEVMPNGHLVVAGEKQIGVNQNVDVLRFSGTVDPRLVQPGSIVSSTQVANVRVESRGRGAQGEAQTVGWLSRFFLSFQPF